MEETSGRKTEEGFIFQDTQHNDVVTLDRPQILQGGPLYVAPTVSSDQTFISVFGVWTILSVSMKQELATGFYNSMNCELKSLKYVNT